MSIPIPTVAETQARIIALWRNRFPGRALGNTSFLGKLSQAEAMTFYMFLQSVVAADDNAKPSDRSSLASLVEWAETIGLPNGNGGYGQKLSTVARGLTGTITGTNGTVYPAGLTLLASDGSTTFVLVSTVAIPGSAPGTGSVVGTFDAQTGGTVGNLRANDVLTWSSAPSGSDTTVVLLSGPSTLGIDVESAADLLERILQRFRAPSKGGTAADFRSWAESVSGVHRAYVYPRFGGLGTVRTIVVSAGSGRARGNVSAENVHGYVTSVMSCFAQGQTVSAPYVPDYADGPGGRGGLSIRARVTPSVKYAFDWDDTGGPYSVFSYAAPSGGNPATVTLNTSAPGSLKSAITSQADARLQILVSTTGGPPVPIQVQCRGFSDGGGRTTLTLESPLPVGFDRGAWVAPTSGDTVYAGSSFATPIAAAILAYVNSLGPSRVSGLADANDFWEDTVAIARLEQIVLDQNDADGALFASNILHDGLTIANGSIAAATTDVQGIEDIVNGPELLWAKWIAVTQ